MGDGLMGRQLDRPATTLRGEIEPAQVGVLEGLLILLHGACLAQGGGNLRRTGREPQRLFELRRAFVETFERAEYHAQVEARARVAGLRCDGLLERGNRFRGLPLRVQHGSQAPTGGEIPRFCG